MAGETLGFVFLVRLRLKINAARRRIEAATAPTETPAMNPDLLVIGEDGERVGAAVAVSVEVVSPEILGSGKEDVLLATGTVDLDED